MSDSPDPLAELVSSARKELARLQRTENLDLRSELRYRVWPFLLELAEIAQQDLADDDEVGTVSVDLVARTVGLILGLANRLSEFVGEGEMQDLAARAAEVTEELMALCDPDELATYVATPGNQPIIDAEIVDPPQPAAAATAEEKDPRNNTDVGTSVPESGS